MFLLGGNSRQALATLRGNLDAALKGASVSDCENLSNDLFTALGAIESSAGLRRALTDPARDAEAKAKLISDLFGSSLKSPALNLLTSAVALRWSNPSDLADAVEQVAVEAQSAAANGDNQLDGLLNQLFLFKKILIENPDLRTALINATDSQAHKVELISGLFANKFSKFAIKLISQIVLGRSGRSIEKTLDAHTFAVTARRNRVNAFVKSSVALTTPQQTRLTESLTKKIGQSVHLNLEIDPEVIGGISVRFGDEIIDGTIKNRLAEASRTLVS